MASVGALGIGLSIVFGVFLVLLLAELYYLLFWKRKSLRVNSVALNEPGVGAGAGNAAAPDHHQAVVAKMFESRRGFMVGIDGECVLAPPRFLFTIKEETREDLESEDAKLKAKLANPSHGHVVVQVFQDHHQLDESEKPLLQLCSSSSEASTSSSGSSSARSSEDERPEGGEDEDEGTLDEIEIDPPLAAAGKSMSPADDQVDEGCTTPFLTPPSSPGFSTPSSSPLRMLHRSSSSSCYESPPSPPLAPMPVLGRSSSGQEMSEPNSSPHFTPLSCSSRGSARQ